MTLARAVGAAKPGRVDPRDVRTRRSRTMTTGVRILRHDDVRTALPMAACIDAVEAAFVAYSTGGAQIPSVIHLDVPEAGGEIHVKAGHLDGRAGVRREGVERILGRGSAGARRAGGRLRCPERLARRVPAGRRVRDGSANGSGRRGRRAMVGARTRGGRGRDRHRAPGTQAGRSAPRPPAPAARDPCLGTRPRARGARGLRRRRCRCRHRRGGRPRRRRRHHLHGVARADPHGRTTCARAPT